MNSLNFKAMALLLSGALLLLPSTLLGATDVSKRPLVPSAAAKPNVIFGLDDSGSMDFEVMLGTNDGALWWSDTLTLDGTVGSGWDAKGNPLYNASGASGGGWTKFTYLFPNGCNDATRVLCDSSGHYAIPPSKQFAWLRSSEHNPLYYNPAINYAPWTSAYLNGALKTFKNAKPDAALSHPLYTTTFNATATVPFATNTTANTVFYVRPGMVVPAGGRIRVGSTWQTQASDFVVPVGVAYWATMEYYPATYWVSAPCSVSAANCARAPNGTTLMRYEIKPGVSTYPSGRTYTAEMQNFANWFEFYRKRKLMLSANAGNVLDSLTGMRMGLVYFNDQEAVTMYDSDLADSSKNAKVVIGKFYQNSSSGGTPTRETLNFIGNQFTTNKSVVTLSCQKNSAFVMTDGFANATKVSPPTYTSGTYGGASPYTTTYEGTLADIALSYYTNNLRPDLKAGTVPASPPTVANPQNDGNSDPHMNTYAMTMGAKGTLWPAVTNAYTAKIDWPNPSVGRSPTAVDDLWHATVNGRGQMFTAKNSAETAASIQAAMTSILASSGSQSAVAFSTTNIRPDEAIGFVGSYTPVGWSGDIAAYPVDPNTGVISGASASRLWSANQLLENRAYTSRAIGTWNGTKGAELSETAVWSALQGSGNIPGSLTDFIAYLKGQRIHENTTYRARSGLMGPVINAEPVSWLADKVVYAASNEGLLHAFDKSTGAELWAYAPGFARADIAAAAKPGATFSTILDGTPVVAKVSATQTLLVGGRGSAGPGFYALDVTNPRGTVNGYGSAAQSDALVAARALWEFPNADTDVATSQALGSSTGKPLLVNTSRWGWVVIVTSGYNSTLDGKGRLFVINANTGKLLDTLTTTAGTLAKEAGLNAISGFLEADNTVQYVYGGDLLGNLWKFDLSSSTVARLATLTNSSNAPLPVTTSPELAAYPATPTAPARRMVFVGTGKLLGTTDFADTSVNSFFALWDRGSEINPGYVQGDLSTNLRNFLAPRVITVDSKGVRTGSGELLTGDSQSQCTGATKTWKAGVCYTNTVIDWNTQRGWFVTTPVGEKSNTDPSIGLGVISWTTNSPSLVSCSSSSALYFADAETGLQLPASRFPDGTPVYGAAFSTTLASRPVIAKLPSGVISITTHQSDNTTRTTVIKNSGGATVAVKRGKVAWRQVLR